MKNPLKELIKELIREIIVEGGNVFKSDIEVSAVPKPHLAATLKRSLKDAGMSKVRNHLVGNVSKPYLGDVDVGIEFADLVKLFGSNGEKKDFWEKAEVYMKKQKVKDYAINKGLQQIHTLSPLVDKKGKHLNAVDKTGKDLGTPGWIQIDFMIGKVEFMKDMLSGSIDSKYKAAWRNQLLVDIMANTTTDTESEVKHKFQINRKMGLQYVRYINKGKRKKKLNVKTVSTNMDEVASYVFGDKYKWKDIDTFEKMWKAFHSSSFRWKNKRKEIIKTFKDALVRQKMDIPKEVK